MQVYSLTDTNLTALTSNYSYDSNLILDKNILYTENELPVAFEKIYKDFSDTVTNNFSNLYLTKRKNLNSSIRVEKLDALPDEGFSTFLAAKAIINILPTSKFWVVQEPGIDQNTANFMLSGEYTLLDNRYYFEIIFLDDFKCKIAHENAGIKRFLTLDYNGNLIFAKETPTDYLGDYSPQIFNYLYDRDADYIVFLKNINDIIYYLTYNGANDLLTLTETITGSSFAFTSDSIFRCQKRNEAPNITPLNDPWVKYQKNSLNNSLFIDLENSYSNVESNTLLNTQYFYTTGNSIKTNILSLKNTNTPENYQSVNNPFFNENRTLNREYKKLFTGSNQELGNDNVTVGYESYTSNIILKKDKITYFHVPQNFYPFERLNINSSGLTEAGAIAGDHPLKSDKIFKKKGDYKYTSYFGDTIEENTGAFLCSWLSGNNSFTSKPLWVDRYYNPNKIGFLAALSASRINSIEYYTVFDCLINNVPENVTVFDKPSDLIFEAGTYYAYHHIGPEFSSQYIKSLEKNLIQKNFSIYNTDNGAPATSLNEITDEYVFDGNRYCVTNSLSNIQQSNQFTIIFDAYNSDWSKPFGYQILGNYSSDGFGLYNSNYVTPVLYINSLTSIEMTNLNFDRIDTLEVSSSAIAVLRRDGFDDIFVITSDGYFSCYNNKNSLVYRVYSPYLQEIYDYDFDNKTAFILGKDSVSSDAYLIKIDLNTGSLYSSNNETNYENMGYNFYFFGGINQIEASRTIDYDNITNYFYLTNKTRTKKIKDKIYVQDGNNISVWTELTVTPAVSTQIFAFNNLNFFNVDIDGNLWFAFNNKSFAKFNSNNVFQLSGTLPLSSSYVTRIDYGLELKDRQTEKLVYFSTISSTSDFCTVYKTNDAGSIVDHVNLPNNGEVYIPLTQSDYLRKYVLSNLPESSLNIKAKLINMFNRSDTQTINLVYNLSSLDSGYHNFVLRLDNYNGNFYFIVDGKIEESIQFIPRKYTFADIVYRPFYVGTSVYDNNVPLFDLVNSNSFNTNGLKIKNFYMYDDALNYFDILFHSKISQKIEDIVFDVASGRRNYLEEIERYFKFRTPGHKSAVINIVLKNSGILNNNLRTEIEKRVLLLLAKTAPAYIKVNKIIWKDSKV